MLHTIAVTLLLSGMPPLVGNSVLLTNKSPAWVNVSLGQCLDGTHPHFVRAGSGEDPTLRFYEPPDLSRVHALLGPWLYREPPPSTKNWRKSDTGFSDWAPENEVALVYEVRVDRETRLVGSFGADNGLFVWVNGRYVFGAMAPGGAWADEYPNVDLGVIPAGTSYVQVLLEDHGVAANFLMQVSAANY